MEYSKHNNYALPEAGDTLWGSLVGANFDKIERGITVKGVAGTTILINEVVYLNSDFKFDKAIAGGSVAEGRWMGFATSNIDIDTQGYALHSGFTVGATWSFTSGPIYLSDTLAGDVTQTAPNDNIIVGYAIQTNEILVKPWTDTTGSGGDVDPGEGHISIFVRDWTGIKVGSSWTDSSNSSEVFHHYWWNNSSVQGDFIRYKVYLSVGVYTTKVLHLTSNNAAFCQVLVDDVPVGATFDMYTSSTIHNNIATIAGFTVETSGLKDLKLLVKGKNAASSDDRIFPIHICMYRTS